MAEFQQATDTAEAPLSTTIDTEAGPSASGGGQPNLTEPPSTDDAKPASLRDDIQAAFDEADEAAEKKTEVDEVKKDDGKAQKDQHDQKASEEAKNGAKAAEGDKAAEAASAKTAETEADEADKQAGDDAKAEDGKGDDRQARHHEPPKNFLPDSKEVWRNVPRAVRRDIDTMVREHEAQMTQARQAGERYEAVRPFDELARSNGRDLRDSLIKVVEIENALAANPIAGLNRILMEVGPRKADGQPFSLFEVADFIVKQGQEGYHQIVAQRGQQPQHQGPSEAEELRAELAAMKAQMTVQPIIERFASRNARYYELQDDIALFLQSGKIPASLSPEDRLAAAYDMAVRVNPASSVANDTASEKGSASDRRADEDFSGSKSIRQSPGSVTEEVEDQAPSGESVRDSIRKAMRGSVRA